MQDKSVQSFLMKKKSETLQFVIYILLQLFISIFNMLDGLSLLLILLSNMLK
jgi:hypothetical protein